MSKTITVEELKNEDIRPLGWVLRNYDELDSPITTNIIPVLDNYVGPRFHTNQHIVFLNPVTGLRTAGPVILLTHDSYGEQIVISSKVTVSRGDVIYISGVQDETNPPVV